MKHRSRRLSILGLVLTAGCAAAISTSSGHSRAAGELPQYGVAPGTAAVAGVDTALVVSVDVSSSVDERRYQIQLEGIAAALEDRSVMDAILSGPRRAILFAVVTWADRPKLALPWVRIASRADSALAALKVRGLARQGGEFTCLSKMLRFVSDKIVPQIPEPSAKVVVDVSGDGSDNCNADEPVKAVRDEITGRGATINGLPILEGREAATLEAWYRGNVMGGAGAFVLPADGYEDFGRAIRQKFVVEISGSGDHNGESRTAAGSLVNP